MNETFKILVVDDEISYCKALTLTLKSEGYDVNFCTDPRKVPDMVQNDDYDLIVSDLKMPEMNGVELLKAVKAIKPEIYMIILTAFGTIENAVEAMKYGAFNYVIKGSDVEQLLDEVEKIKKIIQCSKTMNTESDSEDYTLKSNNEKYKQVFNLAEKAARSDSNILILGESGVGKEVMAQYVHSKSRRSNNKFITANCHAYSASLLDSELFGHEKGAFTGALEKRIGLFEAAESGTLFLDEIGDVPLETQAKLLRAIETKKITRIGSNDEINADFRLITATNKKLEEAIKDGTFREDLFFRISTIVLNIPPLRERKEDLPFLIEFFVKRTCASLEMELVEFDDSLIGKLTEYDYPGNVRELRNIIERLIVLSDNGKVDESILSDVFADSPTATSSSATASSGSWDGVTDKQMSLKELRAEIESRYISDMLKENHNDVAKTAEALGISTRHLFNKIKEYGLSAPGHDMEKDESES